MEEKGHCLLAFILKAVKGLFCVLDTSLSLE